MARSAPRARNHPPFRQARGKIPYTRIQHSKEWSPLIVGGCEPVTFETNPVKFCGDVGAEAMMFKYSLFGGAPAVGIGDILHVHRLELDLGVYGYDPAFSTDCAVAEDEAFASKVVRWGLYKTPQNFALPANLTMFGVGAAAAEYYFANPDLLPQVHGEAMLIPQTQTAQAYGDYGDCVPVTTAGYTVAHANNQVARVRIRRTWRIPLTLKVKEELQFIFCIKSWFTSKMYDAYLAGYGRAKVSFS